MFVHEIYRRNQKKKNCHIDRNIRGNFTRQICSFEFIYINLLLELIYIDLEYPEFSQDKDQVHELLGFLFGWSRYRKRLARGSQVHCRHRETPEVSNMQRNHRWSRHFEHLWSFLLFIVFEPLSSNAIEVSHLSHTLHREQYSQKFVVGRSLSSIFSNTFIIVAIGKHNIREDQPEATNLCYRDGIEAKEKGRTTASM